MKADSVSFFANYEIIETIHISPEGVIYRAVEKSAGTKVLIKKYYPDLIWSDDILDEFFNLVGYLRFIEHEYLLSIMDIGKADGKPYVVFTDHAATLLCDRQAGQPNQKETVDFLFNVAEALDFLHKQEILHGGLTPENIAIDPYGYPLLFDFGLSGVFKKVLLENLDDGFENLSSTNLKCTSPEQIFGRNPTRISDIYTFGIAAYYYIFGTFPFEGQYTPETALSHFSSNLVPVQRPEDVSINTLQLIQKCIQVNPEKRFQNFSDILSSLERIKSGKKAHLRFDKRFAIQTTPIRLPMHVGVSRSFAGAMVLGISLILFYYLFASQSEPPASPVTITVTKPATARPTQRQQPPMETPTKFVTATSNAPVETSYELAFEGEEPYALSETISIANLSALREISRLGYGTPEEADVAPDNSHVALATSGGVLILEGNQPLKWIDPQGWATSVQFSPDGTTLAVGLATGEIQLWDWQTATKSATLTGHTKKINRILFSPDGRLYSASADQHVMAWDLKSGKSVRDIAAHSQPVNDIAVTRDGKTLVSCSDDQLIRVWDLASSSKLYELGSEYVDGAIKAIAISSDDAYLAAGGISGFLYQWKLITTPLPTGTRLQFRADIVPVAERIWSLQYIRNDQDLLVGVDDGESITYDATRIKYGGISLLFEIPRRAKKLYDIFGSDFDFAAFSVFRGDNTISINWDGRVTFQQDQIVSPMFDSLDRLDFSPDGTVLAAGGKSGSTHVWDLTTNQPLYKNFYYLPFGDPIAPDGSTIAIIVPSSNSTGGNIYQLKNLTGAQTTLDLTDILPDANVGYTQDGSIFIAADAKTSKAWDYTSGIEVDVQAQDYFGCRIITSKNNVRDRLLVNSAIDIFLPGDDAHIDSLCPKSFQVRKNVSAFSRDLNLLAFINSNGSLEGYDVLKKTGPWQPYHLASSTLVTSIAISPDSGIIAVGEASGKIIFFDSKTGQPVGKLVGNFGSLQAIKFSEDGKKIATSGTDGVVRVFGIVEIK